MNFYKLHVEAKFYLYDGGSSDHRKLGLSNNLILALQQCLGGQDNQQSNSLDGIIVSHPDKDHFNLIVDLFKRARASNQSDVDGVKLSEHVRFTGRVVLTEAFHRKNMQLCRSFFEHLSHLQFNPALVVGKELMGCHILIKMATCFNLHFPLSTSSRNRIQCLVYGRDVHKEIWENMNDNSSNKLKDGTWNESSTILRISNAAILNGDANAKTLQEACANSNDQIKVFQVPHHGSKHLYNHVRSHSYKQWKLLLAYHALLRYQASGDRNVLVRHLTYKMRKDVLKLFKCYIIKNLRSDLNHILSQDSRFNGHLRKLDTAETWSNLWSSSSSQSSPPKQLVDTYKKMRELLIDRYHDNMRHGTKRMHLQHDSITVMEQLLNCLENVRTIIDTKSIADFYKEFPARV